MKSLTRLLLLAFSAVFMSIQSHCQQAPADKSLVWVGLSIGSSETGVPVALLNEYDSIVSKYSGAGAQWWKNFEQSITPADRARLEAIFKQMSPSQQSEQKVAFIKPAPPLKKITPTPEQFNALKNANIYGVWIDGKKVKNEVLNNYSNTDFDQVFISRLHGFAKQNKTYTHQADLMTKAYYSNYYKHSSANSKIRMVFR